MFSSNYYPLGEQREYKNRDYKYLKMKEKIKVYELYYSIEDKMNKAYYEYIKCRYDLNSSFDLVQRHYEVFKKSYRNFIQADRILERLLEKIQNRIAFECSQFGYHIELEKKIILRTATSYVSAPVHTAPDRRATADRRGTRPGLPQVQR